MCTLSAQLSWTTQSVSYLGAKLSSLTGTKVYRNDQLVYTSTETTQGKSVAWTDRPSTDGYYIYIRWCRTTLRATAYTRSLRRT